MSNLIKAYSIRYDETIKKLDSNPVANKIEQQFIDDYISGNIALKQINFEEVSKKLAEEGVITSQEIGYEPGFNAEQGIEDYSPIDEASELDAKIQDKLMQIREEEERLEEVRAEADRILADAGNEIERILNEAREQAEIEKQQIIEAARREAYENGLAEANSEIERIKRELFDEQEENRLSYEKQVSELEPAFVEIIVKYVKKLTGIYEESKKDIILYLMECALKNKPQSNSYIIRVSEADLPIVNYSKDLFMRYIDNESSVEIIADKMLKKSQCLIETDSRIIDCSLDEQLAELVEDIRLLAEK